MKGVWCIEQFLALPNGTDPFHKLEHVLISYDNQIFRYVKQFYTRSGSSGNYVYAKYNSVNNKYYAYTEPSGVPVDAGTPTGGENAFGAVKSGGLTGCWPTWIVQLDNEGGVISTPRPLAVWDLLNDTGSSIRDDGGFFTWYCSADQAPVKYNGTC